MKTRNWIKALLTILCLVTFGIAFSFSTLNAEPKKGNQAKGRYYFRQTCKTCHSKGGAGGEVTPMSKTMAQWKSYFAAEKHSKGTEALTKVLGVDQIRDVNAYLVEHAADSLQPETCGK